MQIVGFPMGRLKLLIGTLKEQHHKLLYSHALYKSPYVAEQFAANFMKVNQGIRKLLVSFENFDDSNPK